MRQAFILMIFALGLIPGMAHAQAAGLACDQNDEVFNIESEGIFPPEIYFEELVGGWNASQVDICFFNHSDKDVFLRYKNDGGDYRFTDEIPRGQQSDILLDKGPSEIRAVDMYERNYTHTWQCGTERVRVCYYWYCFWSNQPRYCSEDRTENVVNVYTDMNPGELIEGQPDLSY